MGGEGFWNNQDAANAVVAEVKSLKSQLDGVAEVQRRIDDLDVLWQMAQEADDQATREEVDAQIEPVRAAVDRLRTLSLLRGKYDMGSCYLSIYSREGGTEAQDWTEMLLRMYLRYCEDMGWKVEEVDKTHGDEAGLKDVTLHIKGPMAYGYLSAERGTHRLARVSPFNAQAKRQTSFAAVDVIPEFEETGNIEIPEHQLEVEAFCRSSGPGGQNVNKVASAVRILHKPTGLVVVCSVYRDQPQNRKRAMAILKGKLELLEDERRKQERLEATGGKLDMGWGTQIRSYVFYDNRVKDHRTGFEIMNPQRVMDGDVGGFIDAELNRRAKAKLS